MLAEQGQYKKFLHDNYGAVVTRFKIMGKLDIAERRLPQDGAINFKIGNKIIDLRLSILPTANNERIVMRILNKDAGDISLELLNFDESDLKILSKDIINYEPLVAFDGGIDGLDLIKKVIYKSNHLLKRKGLLALEIGHNQYRKVSSILRHNWYREISR